MNEKTIATIAFPDHGLDSFERTIDEACKWLNYAAQQGVDLAVLPETVNLLHRGNSSCPLAEFALDDWERPTAKLRETAARADIALVLPLLVHANGALANRFYVLGKDGARLGYYQKRSPTPEERNEGIETEETGPILWEGLQIGGAICVDLYYPQVVFDPQVAAGADLFVIPSFTPGGCLINTYAATYGVPFVLAYSPWSRIIERDGTECAAGGYRSETLRAGFGSPVVMATLNFDAVTFFADFNQQKMIDVARHYGSKVRIRFNQRECSFMLESRSDDLTVNEVIKQFALVSHRDHFARCHPNRFKDE